MFLDVKFREKIIHIMGSDPRVLGYHDLMVHDYGPGQRFASIHVEMDRKEDPLECHELIDDLERFCLEKLGVHLVIHYDPVNTDDPELLILREKVSALLSGEDSRITIHDFRLVRGKGHTNLIFDAVLPYELLPRQRQIKAALDAKLQGDTQYYTVITFDTEGFQ